jgi:solute carrier family 35 protein F5
MLGMLLGPSTWEPFLSQAQQAVSQVTTDRKRWGFLLGLFLIFLQCLVAVGNAVFTQFMFEQLQVQSSLLMSYVGISFLVVLLPLDWAREHLYPTTQSPSGTPKQGDDYNLQDPYEFHPSETFDSLAQDIKRVSSEAANNSYWCVMEIVKRRCDELVVDHTRRWNHRKHIVAAVLFTPAMFLSDWAFNASLMNTSVSSSTVLVSIQSVFVYLMATMLRLETSHMIKLAGIVFAIVGTLFTTIHDEQQAPTVYVTEEEELHAYTDDNPDAAFYDEMVADTTKGDVLAIMAAVMYAIYAIQVRMYCPQNEELYSLQLLLGYIGLISLIFVAPLVMFATSWTNMSLTTFGLMLVKGLFDFLISDYLMFRSIVLTSPTIATVGMALCIPIAFCVDIFFHWDSNFVLDWYSGMGAFACLLGFLCVNVGSGDEKEMDSQTTKEAGEDFVSCPDGNDDARNPSISTAPQNNKYMESSLM